MGNIENEEKNNELVEQLQGKQDETSSLTMVQKIKAFIGNIDKTKFRQSKFTYVVVGLLIVIGLWAIVTIGIMSNPVYRTLKGVEKLAKQNKYDLTVGIQTNLQNEFLDDFTEEVQNKVKISVDKRKKHVQGAYEIAFKGKKVIDFAMVAKDGYVYMDIPEVLDKNEYMYYELEDEYLKEETVDLIFKYIDKIDLKGLDAKPYAKAILKATRGSVENKFNKVIFELDGKDLVDIVEGVLETAENDKKLAKSFKKNGIKILKQMINDKFELGYSDKSEWEDMLDELKDKDFEENFYEEMEMFVDDFKDNAKYMESNLADFELGIIVTFDTFNNIKEIVIEPEQYNQSIELTVQNGKGYKTNRAYSAKKGRDMEDMSWEDYNDIIGDTAIYLENYIKKNDELQEFIEDKMEYQNFTDEQKFIAYMLGQLVQTWLYNFKQHLIYYRRQLTV